MINETTGNTEQRIFEAFLEISFRRGLSEATLMKIAKEAHVAYGTVRYYFNARDLDITARAMTYVAKVGQSFVSDFIEKETYSSNKNLLRKTSKGSRQESPKLTERHLNQDLSIINWGKANLHWAKAYPAHASFWLHFYYACSTKTEFQQQGQEYVASAEKRIRDLLYLDIGKGLLPRLENIDGIATNLQIHMVGLLVRYVMNPTLTEFKFALQAMEDSFLALVQTDRHLN